jgi:hypothetical protein
VPALIAWNGGVGAEARQLMPVHEAAEQRLVRVVGALGESTAYPALERGELNIDRCWCGVPLLAGD